MHRLAALAVLCALFSTGVASAATPALSPKPTAAEAPFVSAIQRDLMARFPTAAAAEAAGYVRYTNEDDTGAISYVDTRNWTSDPTHPSQLWYDTKGRLLGADFSVPWTETRPSLWGIDPRRWDRFGLHVHYIYTDGGATIYGKAVGGKQFVAAGGDLAKPDAATLQKMGAVKDAGSVSYVFTFPKIWDLIVWVTPNPDGAFADKNPLVVPVNPTSDE